MRTIADRLHAIGLGLAAITLIAITLIVLAGIVARHLVNQPIPGSNELIGSCLMVALVYLSLSSAQHIRITVFTKRLPARARAVIETSVLVVCFAALLVSAYAALGAAIESFVTNEATVGLWTFDIYPYRVIILLGLLLLALRILQQRRGWLAGDEFETGDEPAGLDEPEQAQPAEREEPVRRRATGGTDRSVR